MATPLLLLVLFDGLGHELFQEHYENYDNLKLFYENSPKLKQGMRPAFPALTTTNLMSIATGLYAENHNIIDNKIKSFTAEKTKLHENFVLFTETDEDASWWDNGYNMPVWTLNELKSPSRHSGGMLWAGSGSTYHGTKIKYYEKYQANTSWTFEVDKVMDWFTNKDAPANCVFLYFDEPDLTLHHYGINSEEFLDQLKRVDEILGYLLKAIETNGLQEQLNVVIVSDHGMINVPADNYIELNEIGFNDSSFYFLENSVVWNIFPNPGEIEFVFDKLKDFSETQHFKVWKKFDFPKKFHYSGDSHAGSIILVTEPGYRTVFSRYPNMTVHGNHGYDNNAISMRSLFMARGPAFINRHELQSIDSVDLYPLMCRILGLNPVPNNGSLSATASMLNNNYFISQSDDSADGPNVIAISVGVTLVLLTLISLIFFLRRMMRKSRQKNDHRYGLVGGPHFTDSDSDGL